MIHCITAWTEAGVKVIGIPKEDPLFGKESTGYSAVIAPDSQIITPRDNPHEKLIIADLDLNAITMVKQLADTSGNCEP